ncbi:MAG TPA: DUF58 domain-containing protein, partial [Pseudoxanthomonas sp.]|nr:DUF58 domain-containing protein [Pseudoxanthomonas sp.]
MRAGWLQFTLLIGWGLAGLAVVHAGLDARIWWALGGGIVLLMLADAWALHQQPTPEVQRELPEALPLGIERDVVLQLQSSARQRVDVFDHAPGAWPMQGLPAKLHLRAGTQTRFQYRLRPVVRGDARFDAVQLRLHSPLRLWWQSRQAGQAQTVRVYPNFAPLTRFALFSAEQASRLVGAH